MLNRLIKNKIVKNTSFLTAYTVFDKSLFLLLLIYFAKFFGVDFLGKYVYMMALNMLLFTPIGYKELIFRTIARNKRLTQPLFGNLVIIESVMNIVRIIIIYLFFLFTNFDSNYNLALFVMFIGFLINSYSDLIVTVFLSHEKMEIPAYTGAVKSFFMVFFAILLLNHGYSFFGISLGFLAGFFFASLILWFFYFRYFKRIIFRFTKKFITWLIREGWPFIVTTFNRNMAVKPNVIILQYFLGFSAVGIYEAAMKIIDTLNVLFMSLALSVYPNLSSIAKKSINKAKKIYENVLKFSLIFGIIICAFLVLSGKYIILLIYSEAFIESYYILAIMSVYFILNCGAVISYFFISSLKKHNINAFITIIFGPVNFVLDIFLVWSIGIYGMVISDLIIISSVLLIQKKYLQYYYDTSLKKP